MKSCSPISAFESPCASRRRTSRSRDGQLVELRRRRPRRQLRELLDHAPRDARREQCVAGRDGSDRREKLLGRVVLEHEAARADAKRLVDVLVEVERRQDQDADDRRRRRGSCGWPRGRRGSACGCPSARRSARSARPSRRLRHRSRPRPRPRCPSAFFKSIRNPARTIHWSSATRTRIVIGRLEGAGAAHSGGTRRRSAPARPSLRHRS